MNDSNYFKTIWTASVNTLKGLYVTWRYLFKPAITVQYPEEKLAPYPAFRGTLLFDAKTCIACGLCAKACPSECITLESRKDGAGKRVPKPEWYALDLGKCNYCGLCEEACPTKPRSVWHSLDYEVAFSERSEMLRCWKSDTPFLGEIWDPKAKKLKKPKTHLQVQSVPARRMP
ncbi:MAG: NADH-quinone oxidoreductase subunit I [Elusimicrobiota bacterium]|jgi:NADH-quinone oxidoreductase subunit I